MENKTVSTSIIYVINLNIVYSYDTDKFKVVTIYIIAVDKLILCILFPLYLLAVYFCMAFLNIKFKIKHISGLFRPKINLCSTKSSQIYFFALNSIK